MATEKQQAAIEKARQRKEENDANRVKAQQLDRISEAFHDEGFSNNRRQRNLVGLRNSWPEFFTVLKETLGLNDNDSSLL